ncbi:MAG: DUF3494 domain-containing protein [Bacteriovorax sp.]|nr:DUF3494 domain-containing protein [Bacteriovorax sp.]
MKSKNIFSAFSLMSLFVLNGCGDTSLGINNPRNPYGLGPAVVSLSSANGLASAESYVLLTKTGISNVTGSNITGNIAVSPAAATYITGFALVADATNVFSISSSVPTGKVYAANYAVPTPSNLTAAIGTMETAYTDAAGRNPPDYNELATGDLGSKTLVPGLYKWSSNVIAPLNFTISGSATDIWIFQIAGNLSLASGVNITLTGGALPKNIFWQVAGQVTLGTSSHFEGVILCKTAVTLGTLASINGRILSQTAVTLDDNVITEP